MNLDLNESERKALEQLRRGERQWPTFKWMLLGLGVFNILSGASSYFRHGDQAFGLISGFLGLFVAAIAIRNWHGIAARTLLLKLYKEQ